MTKEQFLNKYGELGQALLNNFNSDLETAIIAMKEHYQGCYRSIEDYVSTALEDREWKVDYKSIGRDLILGGEIFILEFKFNEVHVFLSV